MANRKATGDVALGGRIAAKRKFLSWKQKELARRAKVAQGSISTFETGSVMPELPTLQRIANALEERREYLLFGTSEGEEVPNELETLGHSIATALGKAGLRAAGELSEEERREVVEDLAALFKARRDRHKKPTNTGS